MQTETDCRKKNTQIPPAHTQRLHFRTVWSKYNDVLWHLFYWEMPSIILGKEPRFPYLRAASFLVHEFRSRNSQTSFGFCLESDIKVWVIISFQTFNAHLTVTVKYLLLSVSFNEVQCRSQPSLTRNDKLKKKVIHQLMIYLGPENRPVLVSCAAVRVHAAYCVLLGFGLYGFFHSAVSQKWHVFPHFIDSKWINHILWGEKHYGED